MNLHFNHPSFHLRNYHDANASSITPLECRFLYFTVYYVFEKHVHQ